MATSRRNFLRVGTMCALGVGVPAAVASAIVAKAMPATGLSGSASLDSYTKESFAPYLKTKFRVLGSQLKNLEVTLDKITDIKATARTPGRMAGKESFSLLFIDAGANRLTQDTYTIEHDKAGTFTLFLVPVERHDDGHYQAIITRM